MIWIDLTKTDTQELSVFVAALEIGNQSMQDSDVTSFIESMDPILSDGTHYLFLRDADDLDSFFACGSGLGAKDTMVEDRLGCFLYAIPQAECPNCNDND